MFTKSITFPESNAPNECKTFKIGNVNVLNEISQPVMTIGKPSDDKPSHISHDRVMGYDKENSDAIASVPATVVDRPVPRQSVGSHLFQGLYLGRTVDWSRLNIGQPSATEMALRIYNSANRSYTQVKPEPTLEEESISGAEYSEGELTLGAEYSEEESTLAAEYSEEESTLAAEHSEEESTLAAEYSEGESTLAAEEPDLFSDLSSTEDQTTVVCTSDEEGVQWAFSSSSSDIDSSSTTDVDSITSDLDVVDSPSFFEFSEDEYSSGDEGDEEHHSKEFYEARLNDDDLILVQILTNLALGHYS